MWDLTIHPLRGSTSSLTFIPLSNQCGISQSHPPSGSNVLAGTCSSLQSMWDLIIHPPSSLVSSLAHRLVSGSDTICNNPSPPLVDIVLFGLSLKVFKMCLLEGGFHTLINNVSFSSPTDVWDLKPSLVSWCYLSLLLAKKLILMKVLFILPFTEFQKATLDENICS